MAQKKLVKHSSKRQEINPLATIQKMEKVFLTAPTTLVTLLNKEIATLKQKEDKLKKLINQSTTRTTAFEKRLQALANPITANEKKQFQTAKHVYTAHVKANALLTKQLQLTEQSLQTISDKHAKLIALNKHLNQFEKEWKKQANKVVPIKKAKQMAQPTVSVQSSSNELEENNATMNQSVADVVS